MICLDSKDKECVLLCEMVTGRQKKGKGVYYCPNMHEGTMNQCDDLHALFRDHMEPMQEKLRVSESDLTEGIDLLQGGNEPDGTENMSVRRSFWHARKLRKCLLTSEMDLRGTKDSFQLVGVPDDRRIWAGSFVVLGPSGSGKTHWVVEMLKRHWSRATLYNRRKCIYISAEVFQDATLRVLSETKRYENLYEPVDVSLQAGKESGLSPEDFWEQKVEPKLEHCRDCLIVFDDAQDSYCPNQCRVAIDLGLRTFRHRNSSVIALFHSIRNGVWTKQALQSAKHAILFPRAQKGRIRDFFKDFLGLTMNESRQLVQLLQSTGRACAVRLHNPVSVIAPKYLRLL